MSSRQLLWKRRAAAGDAGDHRWAANRDRQHNRARHDRRPGRQLGAGGADPERDQRQRVQDGADRRRWDGGAAGDSPPMHCSFGVQRLSDSMAGAGGRCRRMKNFIQAFQFIGRNGEIPGEPHFPTLTYYALGTLKITVIAMAIALVARPADRHLARPHRRRGSFVAINLSNMWSRAAEPGGARDRLRVARHRFEERVAGTGRCWRCRRSSPTPTSGIEQVDPDFVDAARGNGHDRLAGARAGRAAAGDPAGDGGDSHLDVVRRSRRRRSPR